MIINIIKLMWLALLKYFVYSPFIEVFCLQSLYWSILSTVPLLKYFVYSPLIEVLCLQSL